MFIKKRKYIKLCNRIEAIENFAADIENALPALRKAIDEELCGFASDIEELQGKLKEYEEGSESREEEKKLEKAFIEGVANIMGYEVTYGGKQAQ